MRSSCKLIDVERLMREHGWTLRDQDSGHMVWQRGSQVTTVAVHGKRVGAHLDQLRRQLRKLDAEQPG